MRDFIKKMPKLELHAHLNGSLSTSTLLELGKMIYGETTDDFRKLCGSFKRLDNSSLSECFKKFQIAHELTATKEGLSIATMSVIRDFMRDNVIYLELRTTPRATKHMTKSEYLQTVVNAITLASFKFPDICIKLLPSIDRSKGKEDARETLAVVKEALRTNPEIVKGIDFSGDPASGSFDDYSEILSEARAMGLNLALHCAEVKNDDEAEKMVEFGMDRCGHGTYLPPKCLDIMRDEQIPIECCLTSNLKCGTVKSFADHHFISLFQDHNVVICTDDSGVFDTTLSGEIIIAQETFNLTKNDLRKLSLNAIMASFADDIEKLYLKRTIDQYFF